MTTIAQTPGEFDQLPLGSADHFEAVQEENPHRAITRTRRSSQIAITWATP